MPDHRPAHPTVRALLLMLGVVVAIVVLAAFSTFAGR
jgi:hypothetical protein